MSSGSAASLKECSLSDDSRDQGHPVRDWCYTDSFMARKKEQRMGVIRACLFMLAWPVLACGPTSSSTGGSVRASREGSVHASPKGSVRFTQGWDRWTDPNIGCVAKGKVQHLRGTLRPEPAPRPGQKTGKRFGGTRLVLSGGESLVVAYGATEQHRRLAGKTIIAHGRYCDKQKQAIVSRHFHIRTFTIVGE